MNGGMVEPYGTTQSAEELGLGVEPKPLRLPTRPRSYDTVAELSDALHTLLCENLELQNLRQEVAQLQSAVRVAIGDAEKLRNSRDESLKLAQFEAERADQYTGAHHFNALIMGKLKKLGYVQPRNGEDRGAHVLAWLEMHIVRDDEPHSAPGTPIEGGKSDEKADAA